MQICTDTLRVVGGPAESVLFRQIEMLRSEVGRRPKLQQTFAIYINVLL